MNQKPLLCLKLKINFKKNNLNFTWSWHFKEQSNKMSSSIRNVPWWVVILIIIIFVFTITWALWSLRKTARSPNLNGLIPVSTFDLQKYASIKGNSSTIWHEVARIPNSFEQNLDNVTAEYLLRNNGTVSVQNIGFKPSDEKSLINGVARPTQTTGVLQVSFFPFFESPYIVLYIDESYETAIVGSPSRDFLWFLGRGSALQNWSLQKTEALKQIAVGRGYSEADVMRVVPVPPYNFTS